MHLPKDTAMGVFKPEARRAEGLNTPMAVSDGWCIKPDAELMDLIITL